MVPLHRLLIIVQVAASSWGSLCFAQSQFRLGATGASDNGQFTIQSIVPGSALATVRYENGGIATAERGDKVLMLNEQPFSPDRLQAMQRDLITNNGVVELILADSRAGRQVDVSAVLRRMDIDADFRRNFRNIVREEYTGQRRNEVKITERPDTVVSVDLGTMFVPPFGSGRDSPLSRVAACQAGIDQMRLTAQANRFDKMLPSEVYVRAESIVENAAASISADSNAELAELIAENAQTAVIDEFRVAFQFYAARNGKQFREENRYGAGFFLFRPITMPKSMTVEVIPSADVKLVLLRNPSKTPAEIDQLSGWTPLPAEDASIYGRFYYRVRNPASRQLLFGYDRNKWIVVIAKPPNGEILFP